MIYKETSKVSIDGWMDKEILVYIWWNTGKAIKKEILLLVTLWMNLEGIMLSEISQMDKDKYS